MEFARTLYSMSRVYLCSYNHFSCKWRVASFRPPHELANLHTWYSQVRPRIRCSKGSSRSVHLVSDRSLLFVRRVLLFRRICARVYAHSGGATDFVVEGRGRQPLEPVCCLCIVWGYVVKIVHVQRPICCDEVRESGRDTREDGVKVPKVSWTIL